MRIGIGLSFVVCGCLIEPSPGSREVAVVEGDWVIAPGVSDAPVLAEELPPGEPATPVSLRIFGGEIVVCPVDTMDATEDDDDRQWTPYARAASGTTGSASDTLGGAGSQIGPSVSEDQNFVFDARFPDWDPATVG